MATKQVEVFEFDEKVVFLHRQLQYSNIYLIKT